VKTHTSAGFKQKAKHEAQEFFMISAYLGMFFCAMALYTMVVLRNYNASSFTFTFAIVNALVMAKVILLGEVGHLGRRGEARPLYQSVLSKAFLFALLVLVFHFIEEFIKGVFHGEEPGSAFQMTDFHMLVARSILIFFAFIPLFAFRELRRVLGEERLYAILKTRAVPVSASAVR
jgi:hypothetical protein